MASDPGIQPLQEALDVKFQATVTLRNKIDVICNELQAAVPGMIEHRDRVQVAIQSIQHIQELPQVNLSDPSCAVNLTEAIELLTNYLDVAGGELEKWRLVQKAEVHKTLKEIEGLECQAKELIVEFFEEDRSRLEKIEAQLEDFGNHHTEIRLNDVNAFEVEKQLCEEPTEVVTQPVVHPSAVEALSETADQSCLSSSKRNDEDSHPAKKSQELPDSAASKSPFHDFVFDLNQATPLTMEELGAPRATPVQRTKVPFNPSIIAKTIEDGQVKAVTVFGSSKNLPTHAAAASDNRELNSSSSKAATPLTDVDGSLTADIQSAVQHVEGLSVKCSTTADAIQVLGVDITKLPLYNNPRLDEIKAVKESKPALDRMSIEIFELICQFSSSSGLPALRLVSKKLQSMVQEVVAFSDITTTGEVILPGDARNILVVRPTRAQIQLWKGDRQKAVESTADILKCFRSNEDRKLQYALFFRNNHLTEGFFQLSNIDGLASRIEISGLANFNLFDWLINYSSDLAKAKYPAEWTFSKFIEPSFRGTDLQNEKQAWYALMFRFAKVLTQLKIVTASGVRVKNSLRDSHAASFEDFLIYAAGLTEGMAEAMLNVDEGVHDGGKYEKQASSEGRALLREMVPAFYKGFPIPDHGSPHANKVIACRDCNAFLPIMSYDKVKVQEFRRSGYPPVCTFCLAMELVNEKYKKTFTNYSARCLYLAGKWPKVVPLKEPTPSSDIKPYPQPENETMTHLQGQLPGGDSQIGMDRESRRLSSQTVPNSHQYAQPSIRGRVLRGRHGREPRFSSRQSGSGIPLSFPTPSTFIPANDAAAQQPPPTISSADSRVEVLAQRSPPTQPSCRLSDEEISEVASQIVPHLRGMCPIAVSGGVCKVLGCTGRKPCVDFNDERSLNLGCKNPQCQEPHIKQTCPVEAAAKICKQLALAEKRNHNYGKAHYHLLQAVGKSDEARSRKALACLVIAHLAGRFLVQGLQ